MADYAKLKVVDLKAELKKRGLLQAGLKQVLIDRLQENDVQNAAVQPEPAVADTPVDGDGVQAQAETTIPPPEPPADVPVEASAPTIVDVKTNQKQTEALQTDQASTGRGVQGETAPAEPVQESPSSVDAVQESRPSASRSAAPEPLPSTIPTPDDTRGAPISTSSSQTPASQSVQPRDSVDSEDTRKRKRRSVTPTPTEESVAQKRAKQVEETAVDQISEAAQEPVKELESAQPEAQDAPVQTNDVEVGQPQAKDDRMHVETPPADSQAKPITQRELEEVHEKHQEPREHRYRDAFQLGDPSETRKGPPEDSRADADDEQIEVEPAQHPATRALYIKNFMRPLQQPALKSHLIGLATPSGSSLKDSILTDFYLDPIKTHCLAAFENTSAASRVRSSLHNRVWPDERTRKPLWADFAPEDKIREWIEVESAASTSRSGMSRRWEVVYLPGNDDSDQAIRAVHQEVGSGAADQTSRRPTQERPVAGGQASTSTVKEAKPEGSGFLTLEKLFQSTETKPKLYFLPVAKELAQERIEVLRKSVSSASGRGHDLRRYTFEDGTHLADRGPDVMLDNRPPPRRGRGESYYGRRGGRLGGDSWRGRRW